MHIPDGILPLAVCGAGYATTATLTWYSLRQIQRRPDPHAMVPRAALLTAVFFVASWIHIPLPPISVHLILNGLLGVILGWYAMPAILVGLFFQAVMFQHGGITTLGVNATLMGLPALLAYGLFQLRFVLHLTGRFATGAVAFVAGALGLGLAVLLFYGVLVATIPANLDVATEQAALTLIALAHIPVVIIEGILTALVVLFLLRVKPELLTDNAPVGATALLSEQG
ncbi:MAG: cobalt transporter CbiM [Chloroflexaceae bacterium]|nr:cobalt transporter CbiM [Chloroflexaceae bacterium]